MKQPNVVSVMNNKHFDYIVQANKDIFVSLLYVATSKKKQSRPKRQINNQQRPCGISPTTYIIIEAITERQQESSLVN